MAGPPRTAAPHDVAPATGGRRRSTAIVSAATLLSRVLGVAREQVFAAQFGAGLAMDAFTVAFRIPNLLRDLFAEGAMSSAFVPTFTEEMTLRGRDRAFALASRVLTMLAAVTGALTLLGVLFADPLTRAFAPGFGAHAGKIELTVLLTRVMMPFLTLVSLAAASMGVLNALGRFAVPALAPTMLNVAMIAAGFLLVPVMPRVGQPPILGMAIGAVLGALGQFLVQAPVLSREGFRWRVDWAPRDPGVRRIAGLMIPATLGLAATQINILVGTQIASTLVQGSVSWLNYAFRLMYLPIGVFGVAVATVALPSVARAVALQDHQRLRDEVASALRLTAFLTIPATVGLIVLARPVVRTLYQYGHFTAVDTTNTAAALSFYCLGLVSYSAIKVLAPTFYALKDTRTPVLASAGTVLLNIALCLSLRGPLGHRGLALATAITVTLNVLTLLVVLTRRVGGMAYGALAWSVARIGIASGVMGAVVFFTQRVLEARVPPTTAPARLLGCAVSCVVGVAVYLAAARVAGVEDVRRIRRHRPVA